jgi:signal transduction histidine kinase
MGSELNHPPSVDRATRPATGRGLAGLVLLLFALVAVLAASLFWLTLRLRAELRVQLLERDGNTLAEVARVMVAERLPEEEVGLTFDEPAVQMPVVLKLASQRGVIGARLYDGEGAFVAGFPKHLRGVPLVPGVRDQMLALRAVSRYLPEVEPADIIRPEFLPNTVAGDTIRLREVTLPLYRAGQTRPAGIAQLLMEGDSLATQYQNLDRHLAATGLVILLGASVLLCGTVIFAWNRLARSRRLLQERTLNLEQLNRELTFALKTAAVGSVTAHLLHGLKSPLTGLKNFASRRSRTAGEDTEEWRDVLEVTRKMQAMVADVAALLNDSGSTRDHLVQLADFRRQLAGRLANRFPKVVLELSLDGDEVTTLSARDVSLMYFILEQLVENAVQAAGEDQPVRIDGRVADYTLLLDVTDRGPGIAEELRDQLFTPVQSTKAGGTGIGLAICRHLAGSMNAQLELVQTGREGSRFRLSLPLHLTPAEVAAEQVAR